METAVRHVLDHRRALYAGVSLVLLAAAAAVLARHGTGWWQLGAFAVGPDVALLVGAGRGLAKGQLHPRAVPLYNALHRFWGPAFLAAAAVAGLLPPAYLVGALSWAAHVSIDRTVGYGLRARDGSQRQ